MSQFRISEEVKFKPMKPKVESSWDICRLCSTSINNSDSDVNNSSRRLYATRKAVYYLQDLSEEVELDFMMTSLNIPLFQVSLPLLSLDMTEEECSVFDENYRAYNENIEELEKNYPNHWILYKDGSVIASSEDLYSGWLFLIYEHREEVTSILTIPGKSSFYPEVFFHRHGFREQGDTSIYYVQPGQVHLCHLNESGQPVLKDDEKIKYVYDTGSAHVVVHLKNMSDLCRPIEVRFFDVESEKRELGSARSLDDLEMLKKCFAVGKVSYNKQPLLNKKETDEYEKEKVLFHIDTEENSKILNHVLLGYHGFIDRTAAIIIGDYLHIFSDIESNKGGYKLLKSLEPSTLKTNDACLIAESSQRSKTNRWPWQFMTKGGIKMFNPVVQISLVEFDEVLVDTGSGYNFFPKYLLPDTLLVLDSNKLYCRSKPEFSDVWWAVLNKGEPEKVEVGFVNSCLSTEYLSSDSYTHKVPKLFPSFFGEHNSERIWNHFFCELIHPSFGLEASVTNESGLNEDPIFLFGIDKFATLGCSFIEKFDMVVIYGHGCSAKVGDCGRMLFFNRPSQVFDHEKIMSSVFSRFGIERIKSGDSPHSRAVLGVMDVFERVLADYARKRVSGVFDGSGERLLVRTMSVELSAPKLLLFF